MLHHLGDTDIPSIPVVLMWNLFLIAVSLAGLAVNLGLVVYNYRLMKRWSKLDSLLLELCIDAFKIRQYAPIWELIQIKAPKK